MTGHESVLLSESVDALVGSVDGCYVDCTFGRGGHTKEILRRLSENGSLLIIDKDPEAIAHANSIYESDDRVRIVRGSFGDLASHICDSDIGSLSGVLLDLGVSSPQLENAERGFSFRLDGPLDMRMNNLSGVNAASWLSNAEESEISRVLRVYGEERFSRRIAKNIVMSRQIKPIETTLDLVRIIETTLPFREKHKHPATRTFQAIRIFINSELDELKACLHDSLDLLADRGRLVVISFHSLEDRLVKRFFRDEERGELLPRKLPIPDSQIVKRLKRVGRITRPSASEVRSNVRSRSAIMRVAERIRQ